MMKFPADPRDETDPAKWKCWYDIRVWRRKSREHRRRNPLCVKCEAKGLIVPAEIADHITPHKGSFQSFLLGPIQSLCGGCHSSTKAQEERRGFNKAIDESGWPSDPAHPVNKWK